MQLFFSCIFYWNSLNNSPFLLTPLKMDLRKVFNKRFSLDPKPQIWWPSNDDSKMDRWDHSHTLDVFFIEPLVGGMFVLFIVCLLSVIPALSWLCSWVGILFAFLFSFHSVCNYWYEIVIRLVWERSPCFLSLLVLAGS